MSYEDDCLKRHLELKSEESWIRLEVTILPFLIFWPRFSLKCLLQANLLFQRNKLVFNSKIDSKIVFGLIQFNEIFIQLENQGIVNHYSRLKKHALVNALNFLAFVLVTHQSDHKTFKREYTGITVRRPDSRLLRTRVETLLWVEPSSIGLLASAPLYK